MGRPREPRLPAGASRTFEPVQPPAVGETQNVVVRIGDEELVDPVVFLGRGGLFATPAALCAGIRTGLALM